MPTPREIAVEAAQNVGESLDLWCDWDESGAPPSRGAVYLHLDDAGSRRLAVWAGDTTAHLALEGDGAETIRVDVSGDLAVPLIEHMIRCLILGDGVE